MTAKEIGKELVTGGILALLLNPTVLLILVVAGLILLVAGLALIIYYGLLTALLFFIASAGILLFLHYVGAIDLKKQPVLAAIPFVMLAVGYFGERLNVFAVSPLWTMETAKTSNALLLLGVIFILAIVIMVLRRK